MFDFRAQNPTLEVDFKSSKSPAKSESWNKPTRWKYDINFAYRLSHALTHLVTADRAGSSIDYKMSGLSIRAI